MKAPAESYYTTVEGIIELKDKDDKFDIDEAATELVNGLARKLLEDFAETMVTGEGGDQKLFIRIHLMNASQLETTTEAIASFEAATILKNSVAFGNREGKGH